MFPAHNGVSDILSPQRIMTEQTCNYKLHCKAQFGEYVQVHEDHDNSMVARTTGDIALRPTGNVQRGYFFMSLATAGQHLNRNTWTALPMPGEVITHVHQLASWNPVGGEIVFGWRDGTPINNLLDDMDDTHDKDYDPDSNTEVSNPSDNDNDDDNDSDDNDDDDTPPPLVARVNYAEDNDGSNNEDDDYSSDDDSSDDKDDFDGSEAHSNDESSYDPDSGTNLKTAATAGVPTEGLSQAGVANTANPGVTSPPTGISEHMDSKYGARQRSGLRARKIPLPLFILKELESSTHRARENEDHTLNAMLCNKFNGTGGFSALEETALTQYGLKKGLEQYSKAASNAVFKEMRQLHDRGTIKTKHATELTSEEKKKSLMFIKEKRCGTIKGRGCAN